MKHASFFSGVGGLDLGFERAGIKTVIDIAAVAMAWLLQLPSGSAGD
jgi:site-specific DNA-cytosine methylase